MYFVEHEDYENQTIVMTIYISVKRLKQVKQLYYINE